jgi:hypothetical protein
MNTKSRESFQAFSEIRFDLGAGVVRVADVLRAVKLDAVTRLRHGADQSWTTLGFGCYDEEGRPDSCSMQRIQDARRPDGVRAIIEGEVDGCSRVVRWSQSLSFCGRLRAIG